MSETKGCPQQGADGDLVVRQGCVYTSEGFVENGSVVICEGRIVFAGPDGQLPEMVDVPWSGRQVRVPDLPTLNACDCIVCPGLIDVHMHGGAGRDVMDARLDSLQMMAAAHGRHGTTTFLAGSITASQEALEAVAWTVKEAMRASQQPDWGGAQIVGLHLEGPYLSVEKAGAQNPAYLRRPCRHEIQRLFDILGPGLRHITLAPELPGALEIIPWLRQQGMRVAIGHTAASYEIAMEAIAAGADHATTPSTVWSLCIIGTRGAGRSLGVYRGDGGAHSGRDPYPSGCHAGSVAGQRKLPCLLGYRFWDGHGYARWALPAWRTACGSQRWRMSPGGWRSVGQQHIGHGSGSAQHGAACRGASSGGCGHGHCSASPSVGHERSQRFGAGGQRWRPMLAGA